MILTINLIINNNISLYYIHIYIYIRIDNNLIYSRKIFYMYNIIQQHNFYFIIKLICINIYINTIT